MNELLKKLIPESISRFIKKVVLYFFKYYYKGNSNYCPVCDNHFRKFLLGGFDLEVISRLDIIGAGRRRNLCPYCQSTDRDRLIHKFLKEETDIYNQKIQIKNLSFVL